MRKNFPEMFEDSRNFEIIDGWKVFGKQTEDMKKAPSFEETMIIDTIRAMRKDMKQK